MGLVIGCVSICLALAPSAWSTSPVFRAIRTAHLEPSGNGWAVGDTGLLRTHDGGRHWNLVNVSGIGSGGLWGLDGVFASDSSFWLIQGHAKLFSTQDGALSWRDRTPGLKGCPFGSSLSLLQAGRLNEDTGWVLGRCHHAVNAKDLLLLLRTSDGGRSWEPLGLEFGEVNKLWFSDAESGWALVDGFLIRTQDGGDSWKFGQGPSHTATINDFCFSDASEGWVVNSRGEVWRTHDGGKGWKLEATLDGAELRRVWSSSGRVGWVLATFREPDLKMPGIYTSRLLRTTDGGATWVASYELKKGHLATPFLLGDSQVWLFEAGTKPSLSTVRLRVSYSRDGSSWDSVFEGKPAPN